MVYVVLSATSVNKCSQFQLYMPTYSDLFLWPSGQCTMCSRALCA